jgi:hypothetical protein
MDIYLNKTRGVMIPSSELDCDKFADLEEGTYKARLVKPRNLAFHRKYFALLDVGFCMWNPKEVIVTTRDGRELKAEKNRERFRKDIAIATGYYELTVNVRGEARAEAKSISFGRMSNEEFKDLYSRTIDYLLAKVVNGTKEEIENQVNQIISFD